MRKNEILRAFSLLICSMLLIVMIALIVVKEIKLWQGILIGFLVTAIGRAQLLMRL